MNNPVIFHDPRPLLILDAIFHLLPDSRSLLDNQMSWHQSHQNMSRIVPNYPVPTSGFRPTVLQILESQPVALHSSTLWETPVSILCRVPQGPPTLGSSRPTTAATILDRRTAASMCASPPAIRSRWTPRYFMILITWHCLPFEYYCFCYEGGPIST